MAELSLVEIPARGTHRYSVLWLHGLGADGHDFESVPPLLRLDRAEETRFVFPEAPVRPVTINGGMRMRAWYDILEISLERKIDTASMEESTLAINALIAREISGGIKPANILLAGFSQGGVIALLAGLRYPERLGGALALSTYLPNGYSGPGRLPGAHPAMPVFCAHGTHDPVVPRSLGRAAYDALLAAGQNAEWHEYTMGHELCHPELDDIADFMNRYGGD